MDNPALTDWTLIQSFLAVAETGSLSAAAKRLRRSQPTLGRHIQTLERELDQRLFHRHPRGLTLAPQGERLLPLAREINDRMNAISLQAAGQSQDLTGTVRITASVFASHYVLPAILAEIRAAEPGIELELVPSDASESLVFRAADIAVRMYRPTQLDIVARHVADLPLGIFAATSYLDRRGRPDTLADLWQHDLIGYDADDLILRTMQAMGFDVDRHDFALRCDNQSAYWELLRAGCGIGFSQRGPALLDTEVEEVDLGLSLPPLPVWLAAHGVMRQTPRIRAVWDMLATGLERAAKQAIAP
ncbi:LysR family transcriptional regulator [Phaeobacter sp. QD34_3]|uniref:LysR family transcriptional regulator n=1 Tax=unclassified Phaeobacter TaxID=2621772 RepID=UPI00237FB1EB|nr:MULTISPECIES: LysR family transcriptional regulator [unclassified Phaeobacter]MDE4134527.1 LysR family transcriptional regulator [Phaeobacter sp. QD34_3]MDE4138186.1 LysR family transcriptional regulator [Phaeobacter sp. QD34_24]